MSDSMRIKLWGVRGSIPAPGPGTVRYGGNTSCVCIEMEDRVVVLDAGSGIRLLGKELIGEDRPIYVLITHNHWDHIQGFPFFLPVYQPERRVFMLPFHQEGKGVICALLDQMDGARFPVKAEELMSQNECITKDQMGFLRERGFSASRIATNHPGGCFGYRIEHRGQVFVYIPDNEIEPPGKKVVEREALADFCRGADVLVHDAQYLQEEMPLKHGWGHSVVEHVFELAAAARVKRLVLFHHDPERTDEEVDAIQESGREWMARRGADVQCDAACEGMTFSF